MSHIDESLKCVIDWFNLDNPYFQIAIGSSVTNHRVNYLTRFTLVDEIVNEFMVEFFYDLEQKVQDLPQTKQKYMNLYARLYQLAEALNNVYHVHDGRPTTKEVLAYLQLFMSRLQCVVYYIIRPSAPAPAPAAPVASEASNYCVSCGCDLGPTNPRQLCCKTYCSNVSS